MRCGRGHRWSVWWMCALAAPCVVWAASGDVPVGTGAKLKIAPPLPVWPADHETITQRQPVFLLEGRAAASRYRIELARDVQFTSPITVTQAQTQPAGIAPTVSAPYAGEPLADGQYCWRAFAGDEAGWWTPPANYRTFFVAAKDLDEIAAPAKVVHPRLLIGPRDLPGFRQRMAHSPRLAPGWQFIQNAATSMLDAAPPGEAYARSASGQHGNYSVVAHWYHRHLGNVAFTAFVTGDERLTAKGVEMLMAACAYERWLGPLFDQRASFDPPWHAALETAMMTTAVATGYDLLYPQLTEDQRATVGRVLIANGIRPLMQDWVDPVSASRLPRHQLPTGNWVMVCTASAGVGALALLGEEPDAAQWVRLARNRVRAWLYDRGGDWFVDNPSPNGRPTPIPAIGPSEPNFDADGGYKESTTYMNYAMQYFCCFADGLRHQTGENLFTHAPPNLLDQAAWTIMGWREQGEVRSSLMPFGDCGTTAAFPLLYAALTKHTRDPLAAWLCERVVPIPQDIRELVWLDEQVPADQPDASVPMRAFRGIGQVALRSGWSPDTPAAAIKFRQNRGHLDLGTFCLFGAGQPTLADSGSTNYGSPIYNDYSSQSIAHNVVLVDGRPQSRADGQLLAAVATSRLAAASGQLAAAYPGALTSWTRDILMLPGGIAVILDRLTGEGPHRFDYVLHPYGTFRVPYPNASPGELLVGGGENPTRITLHSEAPFTVSEQDGYYLQSPRKYVRFDSPETTQTRSYLLTCQWPGAASASRGVDVSSIAPGRWQVRRVNEDWRLMIRTGADADRGNSIDARLVAVWDQGDRSRDRHAIVLAGRRLGLENRELMSATHPVHAAIEFGRPLWAHVWAGEPTRLSLAVEPDASHVFVNGQPIEAERRGGNVLIDLPAGESVILAGETPRYIPRFRSLLSDDLLGVPASVEAPAFRPGLLARTSSCVPDGLLAIDGDANTGWASLQGLPMPQWLEIELTADETVGSVRLEMGNPCKGHVETRDPSSGRYTSQREFITATDALVASLSFDPVRTDRIRVVIDEIVPPANTASVHTLQWGN